MEFINSFNINILLLILLVFFIYRGYKKGMILQVFNLITLALSIFIAWVFYIPFGKLFKIVPAHLSPFRNSILADFFLERSNGFVWFIIIFLVSFIFLKFISLLLNVISKTPGINFINSILGVVFGAVNFIVVAIILGIVLSFPIFENGSQAVENSLIPLIIHQVENITPKVVEMYDSYVAIDILEEKPKQADVDDVKKIQSYLEKHKVPIDKINEFLEEIKND